MDNSARRKLTIKMVFGIAIPLLIMVVTLVMVGASFAWFSDVKEVTITTITMETAQAYTVEFSLNNGDLFENMKYAGQTAIAKDGGIISDVKCVNNPGNESNRAFSFVNVISLDTTGKSVDFALDIDGVKINIIQKDADGNITESITKRDYTNDTQNIQYAFTWFFKKHTTDATGAKVKNFEGTAEDKKQEYKPVSTKGETLYTPYGKILFDENGYARSVNGNDASNLSVLDAQQKIVGFNTKDDEDKLYDFYIVFAPERLFWSQYFKGDLKEVKNADGTVTYEDKYTLDSLYKDKGVDIKTITGNLSNQMYYSGMDYLGATFSFSATINVLKLDEKEGA